ncbi:MAG: putative deoxyuridine 5'-triphosphate nucleotidohydrolase [Prokaryotic dsDNA virus sp.]|nr:MAG: putative deoxyuridine 5'-triphosphate nucleotidohydrolase [Prokaryotic dsDNA virus sp.]|tara:strand:- start:282 stop:701 length:420 start_codon:yes stop_codon:yes gene_type:complete
MKVKIKKLSPDAKIPRYAKPGDACMDLYAVSHTLDKYGNQVYDTQIAIEIPEGYVGLVFPRSSVSKTRLSLRNAVGVIDSGYRGPIMLKYGGDSAGCYLAGDRIGQIMILPYPQIEFEEVNELSDSERGSGGFGSTGTN